MDKFDSQVARMQALMNYGRSNESVKHHVEYSTMGADGKSYGIVRENNKYFIKVAEPHEGEMLAEDYDYIGGYMNHRAYEYDSYKNALKQLELKLMSLNEAKNCKTPIQESYRPNAIEEKKVEMTEGMQAEIARQRQIMANACRIMKESVNIGANNTGLPEAPETAPSSQTELNKPFSEVGKATLDKDMKKTASDPKKQGEPFDKKGEATNADLESDKNKKGGDSNKTAPFKEDPKHAPENNVATQKPKGGKAVKMNESETLAINSNPDYMDKSKGTEVGDDAPFTEPAKGGCNCGKCEKCTGKVEEGVAAWKEGDNQNSPTPGTGEVGDDAPFDQKVNEGCDECGTVENCNEGEYCADCDALLDEVADDADEYAGFEDDDDLTFSDDEAQSFEDEYGVNPLDLDVDDEPVVDNGVGVDEAGKQKKSITPQRMRAGLNKDVSAVDLIPDQFKNDNDVILSCKKFDSLQNEIVNMGDKFWTNPELLHKAIDYVGDINFALRMKHVTDFDKSTKRYPELTAKITALLNKLWTSLEEVQQDEWDSSALPSDSAETNNVASYNPDKPGDDEDDKYSDDWENDVFGKKEFESKQPKAGKKPVKEDVTKLNDFGKHPAYRKKPMTLPDNSEVAKDGYKDWNDDSVKGDEPFGQKIGSSAPFDETVTMLVDAVVKRVMEEIEKKK